MIIKKFIPDFYKVGKDENLIQICENFGIAIDEIKRINMIKSEVSENDIIFLQEHKVNYYIVKPLDTIESIAKRINIKPEELIQINKLKTNNIFIGQKLIY